MRCWAIEIELGGRTFEVPALPAVDWWPVLASADLMAVLDMIVSTPGEELDLDAMLLDGSLTGDELSVALMDAVEAAAGRSFHVAFVLATVGQASWPLVGGALAQRGFRWDTQPLGAALDAVHSIIMSNFAEQKDRDKFVRLLENETLTTGRKRTPDPEKIVTEFETLAGPMPTGGLTATGEPSDSARSRTQTQRQQPRQDDPSRVPRRQRVPRAQSGPAASSGRPQGAA
jgi:hypothetical protein